MYIDLSSLSQPSSRQDSQSSLSVSPHATAHRRGFRSGNQYICRLPPVLVQSMASVISAAKAQWCGTPRHRLGGARAALTQAARAAGTSPSLGQGHRGGTPGSGGWQDSSHSFVSGPSSEGGPWLHPPRVFLPEVTVLGFAGILCSPWGGSQG